MLFSDRYQRISVEVEGSVRLKIAALMISYAEPKEVTINRFTGEKIKSNALSIALERFNEECKWRYHFVGTTLDIISQYPDWLCAYAEHLFDVIELQYEEITVKWKLKFQTDINKIFTDYEVPWVLSGGRMYKIDSQQFECDLKQKQLERLREISYSLPVFQSAYEEYRKALEFFQNEDYAEAVSNAGKSYESVMKIILKTEKGTADQLTKAVVKGEGLELPGSMTGDGFKDKVLMTLPYIRNNSTASHGAGMNSSQISKDMANLAINLAASLNTFLIDTYKEKISNKA